MALRQQPIADNMIREPVSSSHIASIGYDQDTGELQVEFKGGGIYIYSGVARDEYMQLKMAPSIGRYFQNRIKFRKKVRPLAARRTP